jgi:hypothetical protein
MIFEKIVEVLTALVVAIAGIAGINTAAEHADPPANDAAIKAPSGFSRAGTVGADLAGLGPADGLAQALDSLAQAMENAPEEADQGLGTAIDAVSGSPANDAPLGEATENAGGPPDDLPAGPPDDLPGSRP